MVICTAIAMPTLLRHSITTALQPSRRGRSADDGRKTQNVVGQDVGSHQVPLALLHVGKGLKGVAGKGGKRSAKANGNNKTPARISQHALRGPDQEEAENQAARNIDDERAVRKSG